MLPAPRKYDIVGGRATGTHRSRRSEHSGPTRLSNFRRRSSFMSGPRRSAPPKRYSGAWPGARRSKDAQTTPARRVALNACAKPRRRSMNAGAGRSLLSRGLALEFSAGAHPVVEFAAFRLAFFHPDAVRQRPDALFVERIVGRRQIAWRTRFLRLVRLSRCCPAQFPSDCLLCGRSSSVVFALSPQSAPSCLSLSAPLCAPRRFLLNPIVGGLMTFGDFVATREAGQSHISRQLAQGSKLRSTVRRTLRAKRAAFELSVDGQGARMFAPGEGSRPPGSNALVVRCHARALKR